MFRISFQISDFNHCPSWPTQISSGSRPMLVQLFSGRGWGGARRVQGYKRVRGGCKGNRWWRVGVGRWEGKGSGKATARAVRLLPTWPTMPELHMLWMRCTAGVSKISIYGGYMYLRLAKTREGWLPGSQKRKTKPWPRPPRAPRAPTLPHAPAPSTPSHIHLNRPVVMGPTGPPGPMRAPMTSRRCMSVLCRCGRGGGGQERVCMVCRARD